MLVLGKGAEERANVRRIFTGRNSEKGEGKGHSCPGSFRNR